MARSFVAGLLACAPQFSLITNQWVNSYKRLARGTEAPVYLTWSRANQSDLVRIPEHNPNRPQTTRVEFRGADSAANPYLAFSVLLAAGLKGIADELEPPAPAEDDVFELTDAQRQARGIAELPRSLGQAIQEFEQSDLAVEALGQHVRDAVLQNKRLEWDAFRSQVTDYELRRYLPVL